MDQNLLRATGPVAARTMCGIRLAVVTAANATVNLRRSIMAISPVEEIISKLPGAVLTGLAGLRHERRPQSDYIGIGGVQISHNGVAFLHAGGAQPMTSATHEIGFVTTANKAHANRHKASVDPPLLSLEDACNMNLRRSASE